MIVCTWVPASFCEPQLLINQAREPERQKPRVAAGRNGLKTSLQLHKFRCHLAPVHPCVTSPEVSLVRRSIRPDAAAWQGSETEMFRFDSNVDTCPSLDLEIWMWRAQEKLFDNLQEQSLWDLPIPNDTIRSFNKNNTAI